MNENDLFFLDDINGNPRFYVDEEYSQLYTGFTEDYLNQKYFLKTNKIESIAQMKYNMQNGFVY